MSKRMTVHYETRPIYDICFYHDYSNICEELCKLSYHKQTKICIVTDTNVELHQLNPFLEQLQSEFQTVRTFVFQAGEPRKNLETVSELYEQLILEKFDRSDLLLALGGGVVGDLCGFCASTYLRGIDFVQIPTTLLAMVDSSIGGKTGVDFKSYKNMVGAFYMPKLVYMNFSSLKTLPKRELFSGMAEVAKHGLIKSSVYFELIKKSYEPVNHLDFKVMETIIYESCLIKKEVVEIDPKEKGERALLNFGHTIGHAIEKLMNFQLLHGECVAIGCVAAAYLSMERKYLSREDYENIKDIFVQFHLPIAIETRSFSANDVLQTLKSDKKMQNGQIKFVLLNAIGDAYIDPTITDEELLLAIREILK